MSEERQTPKAVVTGTVNKAKKSLWKKIIETFTVTNIKDSRNYVIEEVLVPGLLDMLYDGITRGAGKLIYGDKGSPKSRTRGNGGINYSGIRRLSDGEAYRSISNRRERDTAITGIYDYNEIELATRADAETLLDTMCEYLEIHDIVTVADMYSMANYTGGDYTDNYWGWSSLAGARVVRSADGWTLKLPKVVNLKEIK